MQKSQSQKQFEFQDQPKNDDEIRRSLERIQNTIKQKQPQISQIKEELKKRQIEELRASQQTQRKKSVLKNFESNAQSIAFEEQMRNRNSDLKGDSSTLNRISEIYLTDPAASSDTPQRIQTPLRNGLFSEQQDMDAHMRLTFMSPSNSAANINDKNYQSVFHPARSESPKINDFSSQVRIKTNSGSSVKSSLQSSRVKSLMRSKNFPKDFFQQQ